MKIIVGCEESQAICIAFRKLGHEAYSCDLQPCSGGHPEWHIQDDVLNHLDDGWDLGIFHPECKDLCWSGERWFKEGKKDIALREQAFEFFKKCYYAPIPKVAVENSYSWFLRRNFMWETQTVHPFHFGSPYRKSICWWLRNLPPLIPTNIVWRREPSVHNQWPSKERSKNRAKTDPKVADAIALQWGGHIGCCCEKPFGNPAHYSTCCHIHTERPYECQNENCKCSSENKE